MNNKCDLFHRIKVGASCLNQTPCDLSGNSARIIALLTEARARGVTLINLPELSITGYGCEDRFFSPSFVHEASLAAQECMRAASGLICNLGIPIEVGGSLYNGNLIVVDGEATAVILKKHLCNDGVHYETRWFNPWPVGKSVDIDWFGKKIPVGDVVLDIGGITLGYEICHDAWVRDRHANDLKQRGVKLICNPSASHFARDKHFIVRQLVRDGSRGDAVYIFSNLLGCEAGRMIYGGDRLVAQNGEILKVGERFGYSDFELTTVEVEIKSSSINEESWPLTARAPLPPPPVSAVSSPVESICRLSCERITLGSEELTDRLAFEEFTRATSLGLFDYLRKSRSFGFTISLSGGADSAANCILVHLMLKLALAHSTLQEISRKLAYIPAIQEKLVKFIEQNDASEFLSTAYQKTRNSSEITENAAREIARSCGSKFICLDVDPIFSAYMKICEEAIGRPLAWEGDGLTLQNIQARVRSPGIWAIANINRHILITTSNRSELSVGYATMDGDTSGGLAPIAGVDKSFLRRWLKWMEASGIAERGPIPELSLINKQEPTAELLPAHFNQLDETDLMPYEILNFIESEYIYRRCSCKEIVGELQLRFPDYYDQAANLVDRFLQLWRANQWKRERAAPGFHLDKYSVDPKSWCRYPILSEK